MIWDTWGYMGLAELGNNVGTVQGKQVVSVGMECMRMNVLLE